MHTVLTWTDHLCVLCFSRQCYWYAAGPARWGKIWNDSDLHSSLVYTWCPEDMAEVLQSHTQTHPQNSVVEIYITWFHDLWGKPPESCWSQQAWTSLLQLVTHHWGTGEELQIFVPPTAPLRGLIACLTPTQLPGDWEIDLLCGEASLEEVEDLVDRWQATGGLQLLWTHIVLPSGVSEDSLKARTDKLREVGYGRGEKMVNDPQFITETGEMYNWSDA